MPHLRELVKLHRDDPFVLIGVNTGDDPESYRKGLEEYGVTWLSAYQGESSPIADLFAVQGYPTYLVIDAEGVIRHRGHGGQEVDAVIARLLAEMKAGEGPEEGGESR
jgi:hypothetical protein